MIPRHIHLVMLLAGAPLGLLSAQTPVRGSEVERLGFLVGTFEGQVRSSPPGAAAQTGRMTYSGEWSLDGWIVRSQYEQTIGGNAPVRGLLIFRWRPGDSTYAFEAYANTPMEPHRLSGRWDGRLIYEGKYGSMAFREIWQSRGTDTLVTSMEFQSGDHWTTVNEAMLIRQR